MTVTYITDSELSERFYKKKCGRNRTSLLLMN